MITPGSLGVTSVTPGYPVLQCLAVNIMLPNSDHYYVADWILWKKFRSTKTDSFAVRLDDQCNLIFLCTSHSSLLCSYF